MTYRIDITGKRFGSWTVIKHSHGYHWDCLCDCGTQSKVVSVALRQGLSKSCGCQKGALLSLKKTTHGMTGSTEYMSWLSMKSRCNDEKNNRYSSYGGRGIKVCPQWESFEQFLADMGNKPSPKHSIDRIDVNGNYEPGNVRWATFEEQCRNKQNTRRVVYQGREMNLDEFSSSIGIPKSIIRQRLFKKWTVERIATTPIILPTRKLTDEQVLEVKESTLPRSVLARKYSVSESLIGKIHHGIDGYRHLK